MSAAIAVRWEQAVHTTGTIVARPQGGDTRSHRIEAFSGVNPAAVAVLKDIRRVKLAALHAERAWCFFLDQHGLALPHRHDRQKNRARSRAGAT
jgi:hypothetical protein